MDLFAEELKVLGGFRLSRFAVLNWGTFDQKIWEMAPGGDNSLLTGNIGSGKSTLVDGLTTLLVPPRKLAFNKAAGAEDKERSLESYFHGYYTSQQETTGKARSIGLRHSDHYSVLLATFHSAALKEHVSLAQVFSLKSGEKKVQRLYVFSRRALQIEQDFCDFGTQILALRKRLRKDNQIELFDNFAPYQQAFSKCLGLGSDGKALELFNQTISMKSVGSVTDFVRQNMLEQPAVEEQLQELERNYDDLKRLHDAVVAARKKVELLTPVIKSGAEAAEFAKEKDHLMASRDAIDGFMAIKAIALYQARMSKNEQQLSKLELQKTSQEEEKSTLENRQYSLLDQIREQGGGRLQQIDHDISRLAKQRDDSVKLYHNYQTLTQALSLSDDLDVDRFISNRAHARTLTENFTAELNALEADQDETKHQQRTLNEQRIVTRDELDALRQRQSNIPARQLAIREKLCQTLNVPESRIPFVGELIQVKPGEQAWQGAIERVLHNFALSLMVPEDLYVKVTEFVENTHLKSRVVYYRVASPQTVDWKTPDQSSLIGKIEVKSDSEHFDWLYAELQKRFDYICCEELSDFRRHPKAITLHGQVKSGGLRHEKDDRHALSDQSRYVLGWSNADKIRFLTQQLQSYETQLAKVEASLAELRHKRGSFETLNRHSHNLADFPFSFDQLNWPQVANQITELQQEKQRLEESSDQLKLLQTELFLVQEQIRDMASQYQHLLKEIGKTQQILEDDQAVVEVKQQLANSISKVVRAECFPTLETIYDQQIAGAVMRIDMLDNQTTELRRVCNDRINSLGDKQKRREENMVKSMQIFSDAFPADVQETDQSVDALPDYQRLLQRLQEEDLPRHEARFKEMLNRDTIRAMALFRSHLDRQEEEIDSRVRLINESLYQLDYQQGTFIEIASIHSADVDIRDFKQRLKECVEYSTDDSLYSEEKFERVKSLIEQMRNEPRWTQKVVDVRYWYLFNVLERYREDGTEKECYSDSGGKSGGQKEKLAYSILAAAILLQYRLVSSSQQVTANTKRRFNLVVIDEAFARGSKDSTRFGLELFGKLGLQLLLVTPMQKLDVIEHYVRHVHFVDQKNNRSMLLNMSIEDYRQRLQQHKSLQTYKELIAEIDDA